MHTLPTLPYDYRALEPVIDEATMRLHHGKHHQGYVDKLNAALEQAPALKERPLFELIRDLDSVPPAIRTAVQNNGGGHLNHSLWWGWLKPATSNNLPDPALQSLLDSSFGSWEKFQEVFKTEGMNRFGSGWVWLVRDQAGTLRIVSTANQDNPIMSGAQPLLGVDLWEHAYYLKYQNRRADYLDAVWQVINWPKVASLANI